MADTVAASSTAQTTGQAAPGGSQNSAQATIESPKIVQLTDAQLEAILENAAKKGWKKGRDATYAELRRGDAAAPAVQAASQTTATQATEEPKTLTDRMNAFERTQREATAAQAAERREMAIEKVFTRFGEIDPDDALDLRASFDRRYGKDIKVDGKEVFWEVDGERRPVAEAMDAFQKTKAVERVKPAKRTPASDALRASGTSSNAAAAGEGEPHEWEAKSLKEVNTLAKDQPAKFAELVKKHPAAWAKILARRN